MAHSYSTYEAKTRFSEVMRKVRSGRRVVITYHGNKVAEIRPLGDEDDSPEQRLRRLEERGVVARNPGKRGPWRALVNHPGTLARFLDERD